jgi:hypothetical protein
MGNSASRFDFSLSEETEASWLSFLPIFEEEIWPIFKDRGFSKDAILVAWTVNHCVNELTHIVDLLEEKQ